MSKITVEVGLVTDLTEQQMVEAIAPTLVVRFLLWSACLVGVAVIGAIADLVGW